MKRPLFCATLFYILGLVLCLQGPFGEILYLGLIFTFFASFIIGYFIYLKTKFKPILIFFIFSMIGYFLCYKSFYVKNVYLDNLQKQQYDIKIIGNVVESDNNYVILNTNKIVHNNTAFNLSYKMQLINTKNYDIKVFDIISVEGKISEPDGRRNFEGFDEKLYMYSKGIKYKIFPKNINKISQKVDYNFYINNFKNKIIYIYEKVLPKKEAGILISMIMGDRKYLFEETKNLYMQNGIYHILSISGLHISILIMIIFKILENFNNLKFNYFICIFILIIYCIFTGANQSAIRAVIMCCLMVIGKLIYRKYDMLTALSLSALIILIFKPLTLWMISFQLSYGAILGICILKDPILRFLMNLHLKYGKKLHILKYDYIKNFLAIFIAIQLVVEPISMYYFYNFNVYSIFANFIIVPSVFLIIIMGIIVCILGFFSINLASFLAGSIYILLNFYEIIGKIFISIPYSTLLVGKLDKISLFFYIVIILCFIKTYSTYSENFKKYNTVLICIIFSLILFSFGKKIFYNSFSITMLDVGQGDCIVIEKNNKIFVIDSGDHYYTLKNHLDIKGISKIEAIFITHTDYDHSGGIIDIIDHKKIKNIYFPDLNYKDDKKYYDIAKKANLNNIKLNFLKLEDFVQIEKEYGFRCIYPGESFDSKNDSKNENSLVLRLEYKNFSAIFTGDIDVLAEKNIINSNIDLKSDVLKVAHHGSKTSTSKEFLQEVMPKLSIISAGKNNRYNHPNPEIVQRIKENNSKIFSTKSSGDIRIRLHNNKIFVDTAIK